MPGIPVIAITGGPCGGKSTFMVRALEWLANFGYHTLIVSETATELISAGASPAVLGLDAFQEHLLLYTIRREEHYLEIARAITGSDRRVVILCDRGVLDCAAYMGPEPYRKMIARLGYTQEQLRARYHLVVHLVSAAIGAEKFYTLANNAARSESPEEVEGTPFFVHSFYKYRILCSAQSNKLSWRHTQC
ncbi:MAG: ATP-binding protein [Minisyncoccia bacterium]